MSVKLWEIIYTLEDNRVADRWASYITSSSEPTGEVQKWWDRVFPGNYTVKDESIRDVTGDPGVEVRDRILEVVRKD